MSCCDEPKGKGRGRGPKPKPSPVPVPVPEPEPEPEPTPTPIPDPEEPPLPPGTPIPEPELPPEEPDPAPEPPPEEPAPEPEPPPEDPVPPGDPVPDPPPPQPPTVPDPPPPTNEFARVLGSPTEQILFNGDVVIPAGESWRFRNVVVNGSIRTTGGTFAMRPGDYVKINGNPANYVGGGMKWAPEFANDWGIWISDDGILDVRGTPKVTWNRFWDDTAVTGWSQLDTYYMAPTGRIDGTGYFNVPTCAYGATIPQIDPSVYPAEIVNATRDVVIEGPGHIHCHFHNAGPHRFEYVKLLNMGVSGVLGRYAFHVHHGFLNTVGMVVKGVVSVGARGRVFVPHQSTGMTFRDCAAVNSFDTPFWWDLGDRTDDLLFDRCGVIGVRMPPEVESNAFVNGFSLAAGANTEIRNSFAAAVDGTGFDWPEPTNVFDLVRDFLVWKFELGNVAHNCKKGLRFWNNSSDLHIVKNYQSYRNELGIENGAYLNGNQYENIVCFEDGYTDVVANDNHERATFLWQSSSAKNNDLTNPRLENAILKSIEGPALYLGHRQLASEPAAVTEFTNCTFTAGPGESKVRIIDPTEIDIGAPVQLLFTDCNIEPDDISWDAFKPNTVNEGSHIEIRGGATEWDIDVVDGEVVVTVV